MMSPTHWRSLLSASFLALAASACAIYADVGEDPEGCGPRPLESSSPAAWGIGVQKAFALCAAAVEVDGRTYYTGGGRWLDEDSLVLETYGRIARANYPIADPAVFALQGVDPLAVLLMRDDGATGNPGLYSVLTGEGIDLPASICPYADPIDPGYPNQPCPIQTGRTYSVQIDFRCGYERPVGPYGGAYWRVIDPPAPLPSGQPHPGLAYGADPGEIELQDADHMTFRSEMGGELQLERIDDPDLNPAPCEATWL